MMKPVHSAVWNWTLVGGCMVASAACSSSNASGSDAATASIDAVTAVDAQHFDAGPPGSLDIVVLDPFAGGPVSGTVVVVEQPDSAPIELTTDSSGHAATTINETATVTALVSSQSGPWFRSVLGVERGDTITFGSNATPGRTTFTFKMDVPAPDTSSVTSVEFAAGGCGSFEDEGPAPTTETVTGAEVAERPPLSKATAVRTKLPAGTLVQLRK